MLSYVLLKQLHVTCVVLSGTGFFVRGLWMLADSPRLQQRWVRVTPHVVDSLLLMSAIGLAAISHQYPFVAGWLTAKVFGLIAYIVLGTWALRRGRNKRVRLSCFVVALLVFGYIVGVALTRNPYLLW